MAAPRSEAPVSDSDSGSEDMQRFREAAWEPPGIKPVQRQEKAVPSTAPSLRVQADCHEHDGNELQTTPEFRSHIAKKLTAILDSCIKVIPAISTLQTEPIMDTEDSGFRLFCTSIPGDTGTAKPTTTMKRKLASSSSEDSEEEEQRCREAAVSGIDILQNSALQSIHIANSNETCDGPKKKKKRKKKKKKDIVEDVLQTKTESSGLNAKKKKDIEDEKGNILQTNTALNGFRVENKKKKKEDKVGDVLQTECVGLIVKKKKKRDIVEDGDVLQTESNAIYVKNKNKKKDIVENEQSLAGDTPQAQKKSNGLCGKMK
ncbi:protein CUSTOS [Pelobates fuscus]|uniref:protein CUSTOS n=1 Tax=Pelobates fuscus TaxID=191477 RepID=UPI002FE4BC3F